MNSIPRKNTAGVGKAGPNRGTSFRAVTLTLYLHNTNLYIKYRRKRRKRKEKERKIIYINDNRINRKRLDLIKNIYSLRN